MRAPLQRGDADLQSANVDTLEGPRWAGAEAHKNGAQERGGLTELHCLPTDSGKSLPDFRGLASR